MNQLPKIKNLLKKGKTAAVFFHINPEGDAIGSALALAEILRSRGLRVTVFSHDQIGRLFSFMPGIENIKNKTGDLSRFDLGFVVDCGDLKRVGYPEAELRKIPLLINIDHHSDNRNFGQINFARVAAAAGELVYQLAEYLKYPITKNLATNLYVAISTDTGGFRFPNTTAETLNMAARLVRSGAPIEFINRSIYETKTFGFLKTLARMLEKARLAAGGRILWSAISYREIQRMGIKDDELNELVDYFKLLDTARIILLFREIQPDLVKINFRSKGRANVQTLARRFGGGGHKKAAGALIKGRLPEIEKNVLAAAPRHL